MKARKWRQSWFSLDDGGAALTLPDGLTKEELEDIESWINLSLRRHRRAVESAGRDADAEEPSS